MVWIPAVSILRVCWRLALDATVIGVGGGQGLSWMSGPSLRSEAVMGFVKVYSPVLEEKPWGLGLIRLCCPLSVCFRVHQEMNAGAGGGCGVTGNLCITHAGIQGAAENQPKIVPLSPLCLSQT